MPFSITFVLLQQEAYLAQGTLAAGLTSIRNARHPDKAAFYGGFFSLSIALERLLKLVLVIDHMRCNGFSAPSKSQLKARGHNIAGMYASVVEIGKRLGVLLAQMPAPDSVERQMLDFLSEFATHSRYYNLDALVSRPAAYREPLGVWDEILGFVLNLDVPKHRLRIRMEQAQVAHDLFAGSASGVHHGMDGRRLSFQEVFAVPARHELAGPYAIVRLMQLIEPVLAVADECARQAFSENLLVSRKLQQVPLLHEFFNRFRISRASLLRKRRWP